VLRLDFDPTKISAGGRTLNRLPGSPSNFDLSEEGFLFDPTTRVLRIRHRRSATVKIEGRGGNPAFKLVTFDDPHQAAGTVLNGDYPAGLLTWIGDSWSVQAPTGKFGTFNLSLKLAGSPAVNHQTASFRLHSPHVFAGIDVLNSGSTEATFRAKCGDGTEIIASIGPGELKRLRTGWTSTCAQVTFSISGVSELQFDNLAFLP
jgi:hypothetical protein